MDRVPPVHNLPAEPHLDDMAGQQPPPSPTDSDYFSSFDEDDFIGESPEEATVQVTLPDEWIEFDLSVESAESLNFLSGRSFYFNQHLITTYHVCINVTDSDFQAVLRSFAEFTSQQFNNALLNLREIQGN